MTRQRYGGNAFEPILRQAIDGTWHAFPAGTSEVDIERYQWRYENGQVVPDFAVSSVGGKAQPTPKQGQKARSSARVIRVSARKNGAEREKIPKDKNPPQSYLPVVGENRPTLVGSVGSGVAGAGVPTVSKKKLPGMEGRDRSRAMGSKTGRTSPMSIAMRKMPFANIPIPPTWAGTYGNPKATVAKLGPLLGRGLPVVGLLGTA